MWLGQDEFGRFETKACQLLRHRQCCAIGGTVSGKILKENPTDGKSSSFNMSNTFTADLDTLPTLENPTIFEPTQADDIRAHLAEQGYALIKAMEPHEARTYYSEFWAWLEDLGTGLKRGDPSTWDLRTSWPDQVHGMITSYGIGQAAFMWKSRTSPGVLSVFREIWYAKSDEDLITSFDGASMYPGRELPFEEDDGEMEGSPKSAKPLRMTLRSPFARDGEYKLWPHRDQAPTKGSMISVQGLVNLASNEGKHDGGFVVWPGSHLIDWPTKYPGMNGSSSGLFMIPNGKHSRNGPFPFRDASRPCRHPHDLGLTHNPLQPASHVRRLYTRRRVHLHAAAEASNSRNPEKAMQILRDMAHDLTLADARLRDFGCQRVAKPEYSGCGPCGGGEENTGEALGRRGEVGEEVGGTGASVMGVLLEDITTNKTIPVNSVNIDENIG
ncbi:hypothetical protein BC936DRAFT_140493 [Jimgerdemannia flammicorona]|uniref:Uncharacterized protein n=1 Tax=Jimgerdemannia flammicorona TaxID=994334 RepID=A0A433ATL5_9FUNG|nr:hypothetical protein BC936DRAFT_140493 [Jimgerdemannia flammicorona]